MDKFQGKRAISVARFFVIFIYKKIATTKNIKKWGYTMSIELFEGLISHANGIGQHGGYTVATTDNTYARAFGKETTGSAGAIKSGKISMFRLAGKAFSSSESQGMVAIDPREVVRIDALKYAESHIGEIVDWKALTQSLQEMYATTFNLVAHSINPEYKFLSLNNKLQEIVVKLYFNKLTLEEAKKLCNETESVADYGTNLVDLLRRKVNTVKLEKNGSRIGGVEFDLSAKFGNGIKLEKGSNTLKLMFKFSVDVIGNKSRGRKLNNERENFINIKKEALRLTEQASGDRTYSYNPNDDISESVEDIYLQAYADLRKEINTIQKELLNNEEFKNYPTFNRASALSKLWRSLGLGSDISIKDIDEASLESYWNNEISNLEFANAPVNAMPQRLVNTVLTKRLAERNIKPDDFSNDLAEKFSNNYVLDKNPEKNIQKISEELRQLFLDAVESLRQEVKSVKNYTKAYYYYSSSISEYVKRLDDVVTKAFRNKNYDKVSEKAEITYSVYIQMCHRLLGLHLEQAYDRFVENIQLKNVPEALQQKLIDNICQKYSQQIIDEFLAEESVESEEVLYNTFPLWMKNKGTMYFDGLIQSEYDYEAGKESARNRIFENVQSSPKYRFVDKKYLKETIFKIDSLSLLCKYADIDMLDVLFETEISEWEEHLDKKAIEANKRADKIAELTNSLDYQQKLDNHLSKICTKELENFGTTHGLTFDDIFLPVKLALNLFENYRDVMASDVTNELVSKDYNISIEEAIEQVTNIKVTNINGLSFDAYYLKVYLSKEEFLQQAVESLITIASIMPPFRKTPKDVWRKQFSECAKSQKNKLDLISCADKGDIEKAVSLLPEMPKEPKKISFIYGSTSEMCKQKIVDKLQGTGLEFTSSLIPSNRVTWVTELEMPKKLEIRTEELLKSQPDEMSKYVEDGTIILSNVLKKETELQKLANDEVEKFINNELIPRAKENAIKELNLLLLNERSISFKNNKAVIDQVVKASSTKDLFEYTQKGDILGYLDKFTPNIQEPDIAKELSDFETRVAHTFSTLRDTVILLELDNLRIKDGRIVGRVLSKFQHSSADKTTFIKKITEDVLSKVDKLDESDERKRYLTNVDISDLAVTKDELNRLYSTQRIIEFGLKEILDSSVLYFTNMLKNNYDQAKYEKLLKKLSSSTTDLSYLNYYAMEDVTGFIDKYLPDDEDGYLNKEAVNKLVEEVAEEHFEFIKNRITSLLRQRWYSTVKVDEYNAEIQSFLINDRDKISAFLQEQGSISKDDIKEIKDRISKEILVEEYNKNILNVLEIIINKVSEKAKSEALTLLMQDNTYKVKGQDFWKEAINKAKVAGVFVRMVDEQDVQGLVEKFMPKWDKPVPTKALLNMNYDELQPKFKEGFARLALRLSREHFGEKYPLFKYTPYKNFGTFVDTIVEENMTEYFDKFKQYVANSNYSEYRPGILTNFFRLRETINTLKDKISNTFNEEDVRKEALQSLKQNFGSKLSDEEFSKIADSKFPTALLAEAVNNPDLQIQILADLNIHITVNSNEKMTIVEVYETVASELDDAITELAVGKSFEEYLAEKQLANDGTFGRTSDALTVAQNNTETIEKSVINSVKQSWYDDADYALLFIPENKARLTNSVITMFKKQESKYGQKLFAGLINLYHERKPEMFQLAIETSLVEWIKENQPQADLAQMTNESKRVSDVAVEKLISLASKHNDFSEWVNKYLSLTDKKEEAKPSKYGIITKILKEEFTSALDSYLDSMNIPDKIANGIIGSGLIDYLAKEHTKYILTDLKSSGGLNFIDLTNYDEVADYIFDSAGYEAEEFKRLIKENINFKPVRGLLEQEITKQLISQADNLSEQDILSMLSKLGEDDLVEFYNYSDVDSYLARYGKFM